MADVASALRAWDRAVALLAFFYALALMAAGVSQIGRGAGLSLAMLTVPVLFGIWCLAAAALARFFHRAPAGERAALGVWSWVAVFALVGALAMVLAGPVLVLDALLEGD